MQRQWRKKKFIKIARNSQYLNKIKPCLVENGKVFPFGKFVTFTAKYKPLTVPDGVALICGEYCFSCDSW